ncbi:hypothetical protein RDABS01_008436 [Bienertia sinuspersici]
MKMEEESSSISKSDEVRLFGNGDKLMLGGAHWWWAIASTAQLGWGIRVYKKGYNGDSRFMPLKAFAVASLFVGATATAVMGALKASGIHKCYVQTY